MILYFDNVIDENHPYKKYSTATQLKYHTAVQALLKAK